MKQIVIIISGIWQQKQQEQLKKQQLIKKQRHANIMIAQAKKQELLQIRNQKWQQKAAHAKQHKEQLMQDMKIQRQKRLDQRNKQIKQPSIKNKEPKMPKKEALEILKIR